VGKSTLISRISAARRRLRTIRFNTLEPNLGVVLAGDKGKKRVSWSPTFRADRRRAQGLGPRHAIPAHIERTRLLVHMVDVSEQQPAAPTW